MTEHKTALRELLTKGTDGSSLREMIGFAFARTDNVVSRSSAGESVVEESRRSAVT